MGSVKRGVRNMAQGRRSPSASVFLTTHGQQWHATAPGPPLTFPAGRSCQGSHCCRCVRPRLDQYLSGDDSITRFSFTSPAGKPTCRPACSTCSGFSMSMLRGVGRPVLAMNARVSLLSRAASTDSGLRHRQRQIVSSCLSELVLPQMLSERAMLGSPIGRAFGVEVRVGGSAIAMVGGSFVAPPLNCDTVATRKTQPAYRGAESRHLLPGRAKRSARRDTSGTAISQKVQMPSSSPTSWHQCAGPVEYRTSFGASHRIRESSF